MVADGDGNTMRDAAHRIPDRCVFRQNMEDLGGCADWASAVGVWAVGWADDRGVADESHDRLS